MQDVTPGLSYMQKIADLELIDFTSASFFGSQAFVDRNKTRCPAVHKFCSPWTRKATSATLTEFEFGPLFAIALARPNYGMGHAQGISLRRKTMIQKICLILLFIGLITSSIPAFNASALKDEEVGYALLLSLIHI